jgi:small subunit ribosomal protein S16
MLAISLMRMGAKKSPFYRIVIKEKRSKRDGKYLENVGTYNPMTDPAEINLKHDRIQYWLSVGAQPTETVASLIKHNPEQTEEEKAVAVQTRAEKREADKQAKLDAKKAESAKREEERLAAAKAEADKAEAEAAEAKAAEDAANAEVAAEDAATAETETSEAEQPAETTGDDTEAKEGE